MKLTLQRPLIVFDLETTGTNVATDRIVEMALIKVWPDGKEETKHYRVNPGKPIPPEVSAIHGITDDMVKDAPPFQQLANEVNEFLKGCDFAGFNSNKFDFPLLVEEFLRSGTDFDSESRKLIDIQRIYHMMEPRTLAAAYKFYCDKDLENAHSAESDTAATLQVLLSQLEKYTHLEGTVEFLSGVGGRSNLVDFAGRMIYDDQGREVINFGKHKGKLVSEVLKNEPSYYEWIMQNDFALDTKRKLTRIRLRDFGKK
jgi:DNA polymerase-3 subunit epsilon